MQQLQCTSGFNLQRDLINLAITVEGFDQDIPGNCNVLCVARLSAFEKIMWNTLLGIYPLVMLAQ